MTTPTMRPCRLFIFDLDGTLINSRADICFALNLALVRMNLPTLPESRVADFVGEGVQKLLERSLSAATGHEPEHALVETAALLFREEYGQHLLDRTRLYAGVTEALDRLPWASFAVATNKPESFSRRILDGLGIGNRFCAILGGDSVRSRKPDPEALLKAMSICNACPSETAMVGDSRVDIEAGKAAAVTTCGVLGGFRSREELESAGCDLLIGNLIELTEHFRSP
jgi:phosphoglycolate phosphatase